MRSQVLASSIAIGQRVLYKAPIARRYYAGHMGLTSTGRLAETITTISEAPLLPSDVFWWYLSQEIDFKAWRRAHPPEWTQWLDTGVVVPLKGGVDGGE